jgi:hypothetical protein
MNAPTRAAQSAPHPSTSALLRYFEYAHLPFALQRVSIRFADLAVGLVDLGLEGPELTVALRKLLEAKDCAVRAALDADTVLEGDVDDGQRSPVATVVAEHDLTDVEKIALVELMPAIGLDAKRTAAFDVRVLLNGRVRVLASVRADKVVDQ